MSGLSAKDRIGLRYSGDPTLWHERIVLSHLGNDGDILVTPDGEVQVTYLSSPDVLEVKPIRADRTIAGVANDDIYRVEVCLGRDFGDEELAGFLEQAEFLARARGLVIQHPASDGGPIVGLEAAAAPSAAAEGLLERALRRAGGGHSQREADDTVPGEVGAVWVCAFTRDGISQGTAVSLGEDYVTLGRFAIIRKLSGEVVFAEGIKKGAQESYGVKVVAAPPASANGAAGSLVVAAINNPSPGAGRVDARVFPPTLDVRGHRHVEMRKLVDQMKASLYPDWPLLGPHTVTWVCRHVLIHGGSFIAAHQRFLAETRLDYGAAGIAEHYGWFQAFDVALTYDQIDLSRCAFAEVGVRRMQTIADKWRHKLPQQGGLRDDKASDLDEAHLLLGRSETSGGVCVAPALQKWLGQQLAEEALAAKERRKAHEERALAAQKKP